MTNHTTRLLTGIVLIAASFSIDFAQSRTNYKLYAQVPNQSRSKHRSFQHKPRSNGSLVEEFSFSIKDFKVDHQSEHNVLNIAISFRYVSGIKNTDYPDYRAVAKDVENFLTNYPNEQDYWEIVNKNLTSMLLNKYATMKTITCEISVEPVPNSPYTRASRVVRERANVR